MEMEGPWELSVSVPENKYTYGGKEIQSDFGLDLLDFHNRYMDPAIGRFISVDKLADHPNQIDKSVYAYAWNDPIRLNDPDGNCPECVKRKFQEGFLRMAQAVTNAIDRTSSRISAAYHDIFGSSSTTVGPTTTTNEVRAEHTAYIEAEFNTSKFFDPNNYSAESGYSEPYDKPTAEISAGVKSDIVAVTSVKTEMEGAFHQSVTKTNSSGEKTFGL